jgi:hypothetical protein
MAQVFDVSDNSLASIEGIVSPLIESMDALAERLETSSEQNKKTGKKQNDSRQKTTSALNHLSFNIPGMGGTRLFGAGSFLDAVNKQETVMGKLTVGFGQMAVAVYAATEGLRALGRSLGGVTSGQALSTGIGALLQTVRGSPEGLRLRGMGSMIRAQGAFSGEFGGMLSTGAMGRQTDMANDLGISVQELTQLQRVFQTMTPDIRNSVDSFKESGITGRVAAKEMVKASDAIALAGDDFNEFIKDGIVNSKKLGFEFMKIHKQLTGFTMDFEGTVSSFSQLRAVLPGFATDFGQLMTTALSGNQEEYIEQLRTGLAGAGITSASDLNLQQGAILSQATGFSPAEIDRLLKGEDVMLETVDLDTTRNSLLGEIITAITFGTGAIVTNIVLASRAGKLTGLFGGPAGPLTKAGRPDMRFAANRVTGLARFAPWLARGAVGALGMTGVGALALGAGLAGYAGYRHYKNKKANDFILRDGELIDINNNDLIGVLPQNAGGSGGAAMRRQTEAINKLARVMSGPQEINLKNWRQAERSAMDASIREA